MGSIYGESKSRDFKKKLPIVSQKFEFALKGHFVFPSLVEEWVMDWVVADKRPEMRPKKRGRTKVPVIKTYCEWGGVFLSAIHQP